MYVCTICYLFDGLYSEGAECTKLFSVCLHTHSHVHTEQVTVMSAHMKIMKCWINRKTGQYKYIYVCIYAATGCKDSLHSCTRAGQG